MHRNQNLSNQLNNFGFNIQLSPIVNLDEIQRLPEEEDLIESEQKYRSIFANNPQPMWIYDLETLSFLEVNDAAIHHYGYSKAEFNHMTLKDIRPAEELAAFLQQRELTKKAQTLIGEWRHIKKNGEVIIVEINSHPLIFNGKNARHVLINDITGRRLTEEKLKKSEERFRDLYDNAKIGMYRTTPDGTLLMANKALVKLLGYQSFEQLALMDLGLDIYKQPVKRDEFLKKFDRVNDVNDLESVIFHKDGSKIFVRESAHVIRDKDGTILYFDGVIEDNTERKRAEDALQESEMKYRVFFENSMDAILLTSSDGKTLSANQAACDMFGYSEEELIKIGRAGIENAADPWLSIVLWERKIEGKARGEVSFIRKDGTCFPAEISTSLFINNNGVQRASMIIRDITERHKTKTELIQAKEKAEESDRLKSTFLANMSHEIRTPLNSIIGFSELMSDPDFEPQEEYQFAQIINTSGNNLLSIISDIMDISKIEAGQVDVRLQRFSAHHLLTELHKEYSFRADEKGIELIYQEAKQGEEIFIESDRTKLRQILVNLLGNSIKFTEKGSVKLGMNVTGDFVQFQVTDTGIGIPAEFQSQIFERFSQVESSYTRRYGGTGLGLAISKSLTEILGGTLWLESEQDKGSTFYFTIPISK